MTMTRRLLLRAFGISSAAAASGGATAASSPPELELEGCVSWCNWTRGYLKFRPDRRDAAERLIMLDIGDEGDMARLKNNAQPLHPITLRLWWRPDIDVLAPWQAVEVIFRNGERLAARRGINNIS